MIDVETLRALIAYDAETGLLTWISRPESMFPQTGRGAASAAKAWNNKWAGKPALNSLRSDGYYEGRVFRELVLSHRAAWAIQTGEWPEGQIDHINHVRSDNRIVNLRVVPNAVNAKNMSRRRTNTSGVQGVYWHRAANSWAACITIDGKTKHLGLFGSVELAAAARRRAERRHGYHPNHGAAA
jgi:hypothetical protein